MDLLILCCLGGSPFIDYSHSPVDGPPRASFVHQWDPTDWVATDLSGALLNASASSSLLPSNPRLRSLIPSDMPSRLSLDQCDLWNLTFASGADERTFRRSRGRLKCRCPAEFSGSACQHPSPLSSSSTSSSSSSVSASSSASPSPAVLPPPSTMTLALLAASSSSSSSASADPSPSPTSAIPRSDNSFALILLMFLALAVAMVSLFAMLRGCCFFDCFGGCAGRQQHRAQSPRHRGGGARRDSDDDDKPLDAHTVQRCMEAVRAREQHEKEQQLRWQQHPASAAAAGGLCVDSRRPLIPSVSECVPSLPIAPPPLPRACSPPPSYRSLNNSMERLPDARNTKI